MSKPLILWGAEFVSRNRVDGETRHIIHRMDSLPALFRTRAEARVFVEQMFGYLRERPDLRTEPHGWKGPRVVRISVSVVRS